MRTTVPPKRYAIMPVLPLLFLAAALLPAPAFAADKVVEVGQRVPEFSLPGIDGNPVSFERDIRGKAPVSLLFFMTTACSPCFEELKEIHEIMGRNQGRLEVWAVAVDLRGSKTVAPFQQTNRFRVKYLLDPKFTLPRSFGFNYTPSLAIVDSRGVLLHKKGGYTPNENLSDLIRTFLK